MIFCPDGIIPDSGLTGPNNIYICYIFGGARGVKLTLCHILPERRGWVNMVNSKDVKRLT